MKLADQFVNFGCQAEEPVKIVFVGLLLAFGASLFDPLGEVIVIVGHVEGQRKLALVTDARAIDGDANAKRTILITEGLEFRLIKDLLESGTHQFVDFTRLRCEMAPALGFPVLFLSRLELPALLCVASELGRIQPLQDRKSTRLNSSHRCISYAV